VYDGCALAHDSGAGHPRGGSGDDLIARLVTEASQEMEAEKWVPSNPADPGAFGKEVHRRVSDRLRGNAGYLTDIVVDDDTRQVKSIGKGPGGKGTTQVDVVCMQKGKTLRVGQVFNPADVSDLYEIKASVEGNLKPDQRKRLKGLMGQRDIKVARTPRRWTATAGWGPVKKYVAAIRVLEIAGLATTAYAIINYSDYNDEFDRLCVEVGNLKRKIAAGSYGLA